MRCALHRRLGTEIQLSPQGQLIRKLEPVQATVSLSHVCACVCVDAWLWFFISIHIVPASSAALKRLQQCCQSPP